jgi:iron complex transport system permease protein
MNPLRLTVILLAASLWALAASIQIGAVSVGWQDLSALFQADSDAHYVLWDLRIPRSLYAFLVGAALGVSGALCQALFRNPLADPGLLGVSSGAALAAALVIVLGGAMGLVWPASLQAVLLPLAAFVGAVSVCLLLDGVARRLTPGSIAGLLLTGIAVNALAMSVLGLATYLASDEQLRSLSFWSLGSLAGGQWSGVLVLGLVLVLAAVWITRWLPALNALALGTNVAAHLGIPVNRLRLHLVLVVALLAGSAIAGSGLIGFIGLIAPHLLRLLIGGDQRWLVPLSALSGGILLLLADLLARTVAIPAEVPVGIFTALLGGPFFLLLLARQRRGVIA